MGEHDENGCACELGLPCMPATPPEPAVPIVGTLIIDPTPLPFRGSFELEPSHEALEAYNDPAPEPAAPDDAADALTAEAERLGMYAPKPDEADGLPIRR